MTLFGPIQTFANFVTYNLLKIDPNSYLGEAVNFFIYDIIKIGLLLVAVNYAMAFVRYYFPVEKARDILVKHRWYGFDYLMAALLGVVTPFCSCSSIPLFIGFIRAKIPLGVTFAFLISSPLVNEASLYMFPAMFGMQITMIYNIVGITIAVFGGILINKLNMDNYIKPDLLAYKSKQEVVIENNGVDLTKKELVKYFWTDGFSVTKSIFPYVILGVLIGALIHGFVPASFFEVYLSSNSFWAVPIATLLGAPLYANSVSVIPVMQALIGKGVAVGTALAFITAIVTVSIPESMILIKVMRWQLLAVFFSVTLTGIMLMGYIFNAIF